MRVAFIGDIVGKPGRDMVGKYLKGYKNEYNIDFVVANCENASHGFGLTQSSAEELFRYGIDCMSGGNHSFDKKDIILMFDKYEILRPLNYPDVVEGVGFKIYNVANSKLAVINLMGAFAMPYICNPFIAVQKVLKTLKEQKIENILIDFHAESTAEKITLFNIVKDSISALVGTHTHVGTDDLQITDGTLFLTDIGLTGARDGIIGMDKKEPINRALTGLSKKFDIPKSPKKMLQMTIFELVGGKCIKALKIKRFCDGREFITNAFKD